MGTWLLVGACSPSPLHPPTVVPQEPDHYTGPVIDMHAHVYFDEAAARSLRDRPGTANDLRTHTRSQRLAAVGAIVMAPQPGIAETRALNDQLHELIQEERKFFAIGTVHPADGDDALAELERIKGLGFKMLKLHPNTQQLDLASEEVAAVMRRAGELDLPVLIDFSGALNASDISPYLLLALNNPDTKLILAHMGGSKFHDTLILSVLRAYEFDPDNIWVDISAVANMYADSPYEDDLVWVIRQIGVNRILFGSDFPYRTPLEAIADVENLGFSEEEEQSIFYGNASQLLDLSDR